MEMKWETDAEKMDVNLIDKILFKNDIVDEFVKSDNKYFIVASKGIGKTLLLNYKRYKLEKRYRTTEVENGKDESIIFIPTKKPYLDFVTDFGDLSKDHLNFLFDWKNCKRLWELAIEISALSYYYNKGVHEKIPYLEEINKSMEKDLNLSMIKILIDPTFMLCEILRMSIHNVMKFLADYSNKIRAAFTNIPSGVMIFIDRVDQSLLSYISNVWISVQIGLLEASWDLMRMNHHIKIYTSIRQEAYANYTSPNKTAISGEVSLIKYTLQDLEGILNKLSKFYEEVQFSDFIGFSKLTNLFHQQEENSFNYIYRHTIGRPRDFVSICSKLSPMKETLNIEKFREIVNNTASTDIVTNVFSEVEILLTTLKDKNNRERFLALLPYNVLTLDEIKNVCREFNELSKCPPIYDCKKCDKQAHPFCELYNIGLLGVVKKDYDSGKIKQKFVEPYEMNQFSSWVLPMDSPYYLVHSSLHVYIDSLRNKFFSSRYNLIRYIIIGNNYPWKEQYHKLIEAQKIIINDVSNEGVKEQLLDIIKDFNKPHGVIEKLKNFGKSGLDIGSGAYKITEVIKFLQDIFMKT